MLNEYGAWLYMARVWKTSKVHYNFGCYRYDYGVLINNDMCTGLCITLDKMLRHGMISTKTYNSINDKIHVYGIKHKCCLFYWSRDKEGAKARSKFCLEKAKRIKRYKLTGK